MSNIEKIPFLRELEKFLGFEIGILQKDDEMPVFLGEEILYGSSSMLYVKAGFGGRRIFVSSNEDKFKIWIFSQKEFWASCVCESSTGKKYHFKDLTPEEIKFLKSFDKFLGGILTAGAHKVAYGRWAWDDMANQKRLLGILESKDD